MEGETWNRCFFRLYARNPLVKPILPINVLISSQLTVVQVYELPASQLLQEVLHKSSNTNDCVCQHGATSKTCRRNRGLHCKDSGDVEVARCYAFVCFWTPKCETIKFMKMQTRLLRIKRTSNYISSVICRPTQVAVLHSCHSAKY